MGLDTKTGKYRSAREHVPFLAPLLWTIRLIVLIHLNPVDTDDIEFETERWETSESPPSPTRNYDYTHISAGNDVVGQVMGFRDQYLRIGRSYPFSELNGAFTYGRVAGSNEAAPPTCEWDIKHEHGRHLRSHHCHGPAPSIQ